MTERDDETVDQTDPLPMVEGKDYYIESGGFLVFTAAFLLRRGHCCESGCRHCPYGYNDKGDS